MSIEDTNKAIVRRLFEDPTLTLDEFLSPDFVDHNPGPGCPGGPHCDYYKQANKESRVGFSDRHWTIHHLIAEGDMVVLHVTNTWTHTGMFFGKPPTGKQITATSITIYRFADGKIVESWDDHGLHTDLEQLLAPQFWSHARQRQADDGDEHRDLPAGSKIVEYWAELDMLGTMNQLGVIQLP